MWGKVGFHVDVVKCLAQRPCAVRPGRRNNRADDRERDVGDRRAPARLTGRAYSKRMCARGVPGGLSLLALVFGASCVHDRVVVDGHLEPSALERVAERTEALRQLPFEEPVLAEGLTASEQGAVMERYLQWNRAHLERQTLVYQRMGLLSPGVSLTDVNGGQFKSALAGFYLYEAEPPRLYVSLDYDAGTRLQLDMVGLLTGVDWAYELPLTHELVHALQDHHLDLARYLSPELEEHNEDLALVRRSILESEACLISYAHLHGLALDGWLERRLHQAVIVGNYLPVTWIPELLLPRGQRFFASLTLGHYLRGLDFVTARLDEGGLAALDRAYQVGMPESTEQLLFPEKQRGRPGYDPPFELASLEGAPPGLEHYDRIASNVFGALQWQLLLHEGPLSSSSERVARGWGGDRYEVYARTLSSGAVHTALVWRTVWDSPEDAAAFEQAYRRLLEEKYPGRRPLADLPDGEAWTVPAGSGEGGVTTPLTEVALIARRGARVLVVEGGPVEPWRELVEWSFARFQEAEPFVLTAAPSPQRPPPVDVGGRPEAVLPLDDGRVAPAPRRQLGLPARFFLPRRTIALRLGAAFDAASTPADAAAVVTVRPDLEIRWAVREGLEWAAPFVLSFQALSFLGQTVVSAGLEDLSFFVFDADLHARPGFSLTQAIHLADVASVAGQGRFSVDVLLSEWDATFADATLAAGLFLEPIDGLTLGLGAAWEALVDVGGPVFAGRRRDDPPALVRVGSALTRGLRFRQPLIELRVLDVLSLYGVSSLLFSSETLELVGQEHAAGVLLYF